MYQCVYHWCISLYQWCIRFAFTDTCIRVYQCCISKVYQHLIHLVFVSRTWYMCISELVVYSRFFSYITDTLLIHYWYIADTRVSVMAVCRRFQITDTQLIHNWYTVIHVYHSCISTFFTDTSLILYWYNWYMYQIENNTKSDRKHPHTQDSRFPYSRKRSWHKAPT